MSYSTAKAKLVSLIEAIAPTSRVVTSKFKHVPEFREGDPIRDRSFRLEAAIDGDMGVTGPFTPDLSGQPRMTTALTLSVTYRDMADRGKLDELLASDFRDLAVNLLAPAGWDEATSGIISLTNSPLYMPTRRFYGAGFIEQRSTLSLWYR